MARRTLKKASLGAVSKKMAFYHLFLEEEPGCFIVRKESGALYGAATNVRERPLPNYPAAEKLYLRKLREKTNPARKTKRVYRIKPENQLPLF